MQPSVTAPALAGLSDSDLLSRIAAQDREAFTQFFARHLSCAYNIALRIARQPADADEAVQEAMLRAWVNAGSFRSRGQGSARAWLLNIVAREALRCLRKRKLGGSREPGALAAPPACAGPQPREVADRVELQDRLRQLIDRLPVADQQLLTLYYGAQLNQQEIGRALGLSQRSISRKVTLLLEQLRQRLRQAGFPCANEVSLGQGLAEALLQGVSAPDPGQAFPWEVLENHRAVQPRGAAAWGVSHLFPLRWMGWVLAPLSLLVALLVAQSLQDGGGQAAVPASHPAAGRRAAPPEGPEGADTGVAQVATMPVLRAQRWSFADSSLEGVLPRFGPWKWFRSRFTGGQILGAPEFSPPVVFPFPHRIPPAPFEIELRWKAWHQGFIKLEAAWRQGLRSLPSTVYQVPTHFGEARELKTTRLAFLGLFAATIHNKGPVAVRIFAQPYPSQEVALVLGNCALSEIAIRPVAAPEAAELEQAIAGFLSRKDLQVAKYEAEPLDREPAAAPAPASPGRPEPLP